VASRACPRRRDLGSCPRHHCDVGAAAVKSRLIRSSQLRRATVLFGLPCGAGVCGRRGLVGASKPRRCSRSPTQPSSTIRCGSAASRSCPGGVEQFRGPVRQLSPATTPSSDRCLDPLVNHAGNSPGISSERCGNRCKVLWSARKRATLTSRRRLFIHRTTERLKSLSAIRIRRPPAQAASTPHIIDRQAATAVHARLVVGDPFPRARVDTHFTGESARSAARLPDDPDRALPDYLDRLPTCLWA